MEGLMEVNEALNKLYITKTSPVKNKPGQWDSTLVEIFRAQPNLTEDDPLEPDYVKIGEYVYNYSYGAPFHAFEQDGKHYALYSRDYTATRVMSLPDCKDLGGEERDGFGFCPTGFAVPHFNYSIQKDAEQEPPPKNPRHHPDDWVVKTSGDTYGTRYLWPDDKDPRAPKEKLEAYKTALATFDREIKEWDKRHPWIEVPFNSQFGFVCGCVWGDDTSWKIQYLDLSRVSEGIITRDDRFGYIELLEGADTLASSIRMDSWSPDEPHVRIACVKHFNTTEHIK